MKKITSGAFLFCICFLLKAQIPATLSYQGLLTDATGVPVTDGNHNILFNFYTVPTDGTADFTRGPITVNTFKGLFTLILGNNQGSNNAALPLTLGGTQYYIGIEADGQAELSPRVSLTAVPYAFVANTVKVVDANTISIGTIPDERLSPHLQDLADGSITGSKVGTGINASNVTTGTLPASVIPITTTVPIGTIVAFAGTNIPTGWLLCDGSEINRVTYSDLYSAISISWGPGDLTSTFNLPDLRGRFIRGVNGTSSPAVDPDFESRTDISGNFLSPELSNEVGSYQSDEFKSHSHTRRPDGSSEASIPNLTGQKFDHDASGGTMYNDGITNQTNTGSQGGSETRPKNAYVNFIIKAQ